jgi:hypothetical protein
MPPAGDGVVVVPGVSEQARWSRVKTGVLPSERADEKDLSDTRWAKVYSLFGATSDDQKDIVFTTVNAYFAKNGSSPEGGYTRSIVAVGRSVPASSIVAITGTADGAIRKFLRGRLQDSVSSLKFSGICERDPEMAAEALSYGLAPEMAWLLADWLVPKNPWMTQGEMDVAVNVRNNKISAANVNRGGAQVGQGGRTHAAEPDTGRPMPAVVEGSGSSYVGKTLF